MKNIFFFLIVLASSVSAQTRPVVVTGRATPGDTLAVTLYEGRSHNTVILYIYDTLYHWHVLERPLSRTGDTAWTTRIPLPPAAGFVAYKFLVGDSVDNNQDNGYFTMVFRKDGRYMPGAEAGYGLCRSPRYGLGIPGYFSHFSISDTATYMWLSNEILRNPGARVELVLPYLHAARIFKPQTSDAQASRALRYLLSLKDGREAALLKAWLICRDVLHDSLRADSTHRVAIAAFPSGTIARADAYVQTLCARTIEDRFKTAAAFIKAFPYRDQQNSDNSLLGISYYAAYRTVTSIAIADKKPEVVFEYQATLPLENLPEVYYKAIEIPYDDWKTMDAKTAFPYSDALYRRMLWYYDHQPNGLWYYSPSEWKAWCDRQFKNYFRLHARILMELGRDEEALALTCRAQGLYHYTSSDLDQTEAILLEKAGRTADLDTLLKTSVRLNQVTAVMIRMLHRQYVRLHDDGKGFDQWFESLKDAHTLQLMKEDLQKERLSLPATDFSLVDGDGRRVRLSDLRGKTVVLDFWATWCAPCKEAMAGMNMAVKRYAHDTSVVFFFIDTQEKIADYKNKALAFPREKGYVFHVLFDAGKDMDTTYATYAHAIHSSGIPFKVIIDPSGFIRFANIGYKGSPSSLSDEISTMIELARGSEKTGMSLPYHADSIVYYNAGLRLGATITYPEKNIGTAVVLLSGTGKQDRDGTMAGHSLFAVIADSLTRRGIVVLRSDDRGLGLSEGNYETSTTTDFAKDAIAAVDYLGRRQDLRLRRIGLLGHSEGGMAAAIAASRDQRISFVITLSSPGTTGLEALLLQNKGLVHAAAIPDINKLRFDSVNHLLFDLVYRHADAADLEQQIRRAYKQWQVWDDSVVKANHLDYGGHFFFPLESYIKQATGAWYRNFITYDPALVLPLVKVPFLAINGDRDLISNGVVNLKGIADNLARGGNHHVTTWLVPGLNHLYQHCQTCLTDEYAKLPETMAPEVLRRIGEWIGI